MDTKPDRLWLFDLIYFQILQEWLSGLRVGCLHQAESLRLNQH